MNYSKIIIDFIRSQKTTVQEFMLLKHMEDSYPDFFTCLGDSPSLYKKHFLLFHYLYLLDDELRLTHSRLLISPLDIKIYNYSDTENQGYIGEHDHLREFYLNKNNLNLSEKEISDMQKKFWEKFLAIDKKTQAIKTLGLVNEESLTLDKVKAKYKQLAQKHHPDKGGDEAFFIEVCEAFDSLKKILA